MEITRKDIIVILLVILIVLFIFLYKKENANSISDISVMGGQSIPSNDAANNWAQSKWVQGVDSTQHVTQEESVGFVGFGGFGNLGNSVHTGDIVASSGEQIDVKHMYSQDSIINSNVSQYSNQMMGDQKQVMNESAISMVQENNITNVPLMIVSEIKNSLNRCLSPEKKQKIEELMKKIESTQLSQNEIQKLELESQKYPFDKNILKNLTLANNQNVIESVTEIVSTFELTPQEINCMGTHNSICSANTRDINVTLFGLSKINETLNNYKYVLTELKSNLIKNVKLSLDNCDDPQVKKVIIDKYIDEINKLIRNVFDILSN